MRSMIRVLMATLSITTVLSAACAQVPQGKLAASPALVTMKSIPSIDLGFTDAVCVRPEHDLFIVRRGNSLFSLQTGPAPALKKLATTPLANGTIVTGARSGERIWLFMQSGRKMPYALEANSGRVVPFELPGVTEPEADEPVIQSCIVVPKSDAALLVIDRQDRGRVLLKEKRYVCFWISLKSGKVIAMPFGWSLDYFSADQSLAVFRKPGSWEAIDVATGEACERLPNLRTEPTVPANADDQLIKPVYVRRPKAGDTMHFAGLSVDGAVIPLNLDLPTVHYLSTAKIIKWNSTVCR